MFMNMNYFYGSVMTEIFICMTMCGLEINISQLEGTTLLIDVVIADMQLT